MADSSTCGRKTLEMEVILQSDDNCIMEGDGVILKKDIHLKFVKAMPGRKERMGNCSFFLDKMIGREFGMAYEVEGTQLVNIDPLKYEHEDVDFSEHNDERDNRSINDDSNAQQLSKDDIMSLKNEGVGGQDIIQKIKDSSATFNDKTVYSQAKYLKKKKKKHLAYFTTYKPTARLLSQLYFTKASSKILDMRPDTLGQILAWSDVKYGSKLLIAETCQGLVLGAFLERLGGKGRIVQAYNGNCPVRIILNQFNFSEDEKSNMVCGFSLENLEEIKDRLAKDNNEHLHSRDVKEEKERDRDETESCVEKVEESDNILPVLSATTEIEDGAMDDKSSDIHSSTAKSDSYPCNKFYTKEKRDSEEAAAINHLAEKDLDALIIATKFYPLNILIELIGFIKPSSPIVIYCQYREPLMECYTYLRDASLAINVHLTETWLRDWQILKDRTHPKMVMSGRSGYLLRGIKIIPPEDEATIGNLEPKPKVPKL